MGVPVGVVDMRDPMTPSSAAEKQVTVETLLALVLPLPEKKTWVFAEKTVAQL